MNKELISSRFHKTRETYHNSATVQKDIAAKLFSLMPAYAGNNDNGKDIRKVLEIGCGSGFLSEKLTEKASFKRGDYDFTFNDITDCPASLQSLLDERNISYDYIKADAESYDFGHGYDLIASSSVFQWFKDMESFFRRCDSMLRKGGVLAFSTFLPENMIEIRETLNVGLNYYSKDKIIEMLGGDYEILTFDHDLIRLYFDTPVDVLRHMKKTGVNGITDFRWTASRLTAFSDNYKCRFDKEGKVSLTYAPVYIVARKRN